jgi:branched-chain amino acid transport system ATP-binding protein
MLLEVREIDTYYGIFQAIFKVSLGLDRGEAVCLLGRNGAGKTTTLTSIIGLNQPRSGHIKFRDQEITTRKPYQIVRLGIGFIPEDRWIFSELTVRENLELGSRKTGREKNGIGLERVYNLFPQLRVLANQNGGTLSGGEQQMLTVGRTLMGNPELILLDEPTAGLAPLVAQMLADQIKTLRNEGLTILLTEQNALLAMDISDRAYVIDKGAIVYEGDVSLLREDVKMMKEYLGVS